LKTKIIKMKLKRISYIGLTVVLLSACTKLDQKLQDSFTTSPGSGNSPDIAVLLNGCYNAFGGLMNGQDQIFSLQENTADECLVPTRGGDWDDNGVWRVLHAHTWTTIHGQFKSVFTGLGQAESNAITTLAFHPSQEQAAQALFLRSLAQFYFLDLFGQVPYREIEDYNSIDPAPVMQPAEAIETLINTLTDIIPQLSEDNAPHRASPDAARFLLMKVYLNKGAWLNKQAPTFDNGDMNKVISLGKEIMDSKRYSLATNFFDNFGPKNANLGTEAIFSWPNTGSSSSNGINSIGINARWMMTLHYNSWDKNNTYGGAGWNGFSTVADFYNTFEAADQRVGNKPYPDVTNQSGLKPGLLVGQQYNEDGEPEVDRHGNPLAFRPEVHLVETDANTLEVAGIRVIKYPPDYNAYTGGNQTNQLQIFRYADVYLMVAEAMLRTSDNTNALNLVNELRQVRGASKLGSITLVNPANVYDPNTLLAERGRELYWESWRRQDLIRFGVYLQPWALKDVDDPKNLLFPLPQDELLANPNLQQNPGY
jgi:hypothetical protein